VACNKGCVCFLLVGFSLKDSPSWSRSKDIRLFSVSHISGGGASVSTSPVEQRPHIRVSSDRQSVTEPVPGRGPSLLLTPDRRDIPPVHNLFLGPDNILIYFDSRFLFPNIPSTSLCFRLAFAPIGVWKAVLV